MEKLAELFTGSDSEQNTAVIACTQKRVHTHTHRALSQIFPPALQQPNDGPEKTTGNWKHFTLKDSIKVNIAELIVNTIGHRISAPHFGNLHA